MKKQLSIRIQPEEMKKIIQLLEKKRSIKDVVEISGRSKRVLITIAQRNNIKMKFAPIAPEEEEKIVALLKEKKNARQVAKIVGRGETTVLRVAANHRISLTHQRSRKKSAKKIKNAKI